MERNKEIVAQFRTLQRKNPTTSPQRLFVTIAEKYPISAAAVRKICQISGAYVNGKDEN